MLKFVWTGWQDPYDSLTVPTIINDKGEYIWSGGYYYSGEVTPNTNKIREELKAAAVKHKIEGYDFSSNDPWSWGLENKRTWSNSG